VTENIPEKIDIEVCKFLDEVNKLELFKLKVTLQFITVYNKHYIFDVIFDYLGQYCCGQLKIKDKYEFVYFGNENIEEGLIYNFLREYLYMTASGLSIEKRNTYLLMEEVKINFYNNQYVRDNNKLNSNSDLEVVKPFVNRLFNISNERDSSKIKEVI